MTDYNKSVNFAVKDTLTAGDPNKIVSGAEIDTEFNNISSASTTKIDKVPAATTGNIPQFTATGAIEDSGDNQTTIVQIAAPAGVVMAFGGSTAPTGWLECDGSAVSRSTYSDLFSAIGTNFGVGDGTSTFNLPDTRGEFIRGWDNSRGVDSGRGIGSFQDFAIENITGEFATFRDDVGSRLILQDLEGAFQESGPAPGDESWDVAPNNRGRRRVTFDSSRVVNTADETRPRNVAMLACIKY